MPPPQHYTPSIDTLAEQVRQVQADVAEIKALLREAVAEGSKDRAQLNARVVRLEAEARITRWVGGIVGSAALTGFVMALWQLIQTAG